MKFLTQSTTKGYIRVIIETLGRYRNIKPLQKHPTVTATPNRYSNKCWLVLCAQSTTKGYIRATYRNTGPLKKHQAVTETPKRYSNTKPSQKHPTVTETVS